MSAQICGRLRTVVAEDDAIIGMLLAEILEHMGHEVCAVVSSEAATVTAAALWKPDLMIVDARLRNGSGVSAMKTIMQSQAVPHLFITGAPYDVGESNALVLHKPFREDDLSEAIIRTIESFRSVVLKPDAPVLAAHPVEARL
jgi:CheY-like chemotaxis protein